jgi:hypothetical protein
MNARGGIQGNLPLHNAILIARVTQHVELQKSDFNLEHAIVHALGDIMLFP